MRSLIVEQLASRIVNEVLMEQGDGGDPRRYGEPPARDPRLVWDPVYGDDDDSDDGISSQTKAESELFGHPITDYYNSAYGEPYVSPKPSEYERVGNYEWMWLWDEDAEYYGLPARLHPHVQENPPSWPSPGPTPLNLPNPGPGFYPHS